MADNAHGLSFVEPERAAPAFLLYSGPGVGKSTGAIATAPGPVLVVNAEKRSAVRYGYRLAQERGTRVDVLPLTGAQTLREVLLALRADAGKTWRTVVLDPVSEVYRRLVDESSGGGSAMPGIQDYGIAGTTITRFVDEVAALDTVTLILVTHEILTDGPDGPLLMPECGGNKLPGVLTRMVDHVGYVGVVAGEDGAAPRWVVQFAPGRGRHAKTRDGLLKPVEPYDVAAWVAALEGAPAVNNDDNEVAA